MFASLLKMLAAHQAGVHARMFFERQEKYKAAWEYARNANRPMLIVGGPYGSIWSGRLFGFKAHGCGDVCLDIEPAACEGCEYTEGDIRDIPFASNTFSSAFVSHVLEHLPTTDDAELAIDELYRVADTVYACCPTKWAVTSYLIPGHNLWVKQVGDVFFIEQRDKALQKAL